MTPRALLLASLVLFAGCVAPLAAPVRAAPGGVSPAGDVSPAGFDAPGGGSPADEPAPPASTSVAATEVTGPDAGDNGTAAGNRTVRSPAALAASYDVPVRNGKLPVDYPLVFARVALALDRPSVAPPAEVVVRPNDRMAAGPRRLPPFVRAVGIETPDGRDSALTAAAFVRSPRAVYVNGRILNDSAATESTLAHESVHVVQLRTGAFAALVGRSAAPARSTEAALLRTAILEGAATYVQAEYRERYVPDAERPVASLAAAARNGSGAAKLGYLPYVAGARYVEGRIDDPSRLRAVYDRPPRTTEELLHGLPPGSEPVANVAVRDAPGDGWTAARESRDTFGELFLLTVLRTELNRSAAAAGADGWGGDSRISFAPANASGGSAGPDGGDARRGHAWAIRFDDAANATEFVAAVDSWSAGRAPSDAPVRAARAAPETVVLLVGTERFVERATVSGTNATVTVRAVGD